VESCVEMEPWCAYEEFVGRYVGSVGIMVGGPRARRSSGKQAEDISSAAPRDCWLSLSRVAPARKMFWLCTCTTWTKRVMGMDK
jgi:hypothetical protein